MSAKEIARVETATMLQKLRAAVAQLEKWRTNSDRLVECIALLKERADMSMQMKAAVVEEFGKPLVLREWNIPTPNARQIVVKTEAWGGCHTDLRAAQGELAGQADASVHSRP